MTYRVKITAGAYSWDITQGDDPDTCDLIDPLKISWSYPDGAVPPAQPDPVVLQFNVEVASAAELDGLGINDPVTATLILAPHGYPIHFLGSITDLSASPVTDGVQYAVTCTDGTVDLASAALDTWTSSTSDLATRFGDLMTHADLEAGDITLDETLSRWIGGFDPQAPGVLLVRSHKYDKQSVRDALLELASWVAGLDYLHTDDPRGTWRPILAPCPGTSSYGAPWRFMLDSVSNGYVAGPADYPATFGIRDDSNLWGPIPPAGGSDPEAGYIDACEVDADAEWTALARTTIVRGKASWLVGPWSGSTEVYSTTQKPWGNAPAKQIPASRAVVTEVFGSVDTLPASVNKANFNGQRLAMSLVPQPARNRGWAPGTFRWGPVASVDYWPPMFPDHGQVDGQERTRCYRQPFTVANIDADWNVSAPGLHTVTALLTGAELTIEDGALSVDFTLSPALPLYLEDSTGQLAWNELPTPTPAWVDLDPRFAWADYSLIGDLA